MNKKIYWQAVNDLAGNEFKLFSVLATMEDNDAGYCFATNKGISNKIGLQPKTISGIISSLKKKGYIFTIEIGKKGNHVDERRVYTADNILNHQKDSQRTDLTPTEYETIEGVLVFYNESNPRPLKNNAQETIPLISYRPIPPISDRTIPSISDGTISNINISKPNKSVGIVSLSEEDKKQLKLALTETMKLFPVSKAITKYTNSKIFLSTQLIPLANKKGVSAVLSALKTIKIEANKNIINDLTALISSKI